MTTLCWVLTVSPPLVHWQECQQCRIDVRRGNAEEGAHRYCRLDVVQLMGAMQLYVQPFCALMPRAGFLSRLKRPFNGRIYAGSIAPRMGWRILCAIRRGFEPFELGQGHEVSVRGMNKRSAT